MLNLQWSFCQFGCNVGYSILVPVKAINDYIHESIPITLNLDYKDFEIIILPNDDPIEVLPSYLLDPRVRIISTGRVSPAVKRDVGAKESRFDRIAFLDDDAYPEKDWLKIADQAFEESGAAAIGGPAMTPANSSLSEKSSGLFFETYIGGGGLDYRYKPSRKSFYVDDFPTVNLIVKRDIFFGVGGFDSDFWPGEDTKFCLDLVEAGYEIWYCKDLIVWHHRRTKLQLHLKQIGSYGRHRGYFAKIYPKNSRKFVYFVPSIFLVGNVGLALLSPFVSSFLYLWLSLLTLYFSIAIIDVFSRTKKLSLGTMTIFTIFFSHLYYGLNFLRGLMTTHGFQSQLR